MMEKKKGKSDTTLFRRVSLTGVAGDAVTRLENTDLPTLHPNPGFVLVSGTIE